MYTVIITAICRCVVRVAPGDSTFILEELKHGVVYTVVSGVQWLSFTRVLAECSMQITARMVHLAPDINCTH